MAVSKKTKEVRQNWYFTFMSKQGELADKYIKIENCTYSEARDAMVEAFGEDWGFQYDEAAFLPQIKTFGLKELK